MWLIKPCLSSFCIDLTGKILILTKESELGISDTDGVTYIKYSSLEVAQSIHNAIISAIKSGKTYIEPSEIGLERGKYRFVKKTYNVNMKESSTTCQRCNGEGTVRCDSCLGDGRDINSGKNICDHCGGKGKINCPRCGGAGVE